MVHDRWWLMVNGHVTQIHTFNVLEPCWTQIFPQVNSEVGVYHRPNGWKGRVILQGQFIPYFWPWPLVRSVFCSVADSSRFLEKHSRNPGVQWLYLLFRCWDHHGTTTTWRIGVQGNHFLEWFLGGEATGARLSVKPTRDLKSSSRPSHFKRIADSKETAISGWWLGKNPSEKYELVNWDD